MVQIKDNLNLGAVPDAGATPLAGALPDTGGGFLAQGLGQVAQVGQSVADMMIQREIETEERRMATVQMQVESAADDFAVALHKDSERAEGFSRRPAAVVLRDWESRWGQFEKQQMAQFIGEGDGIYQQDKLLEALAVKREYARGVLVQAHEKAVVAARDLTLSQDIKRQAANVAKAPDNMVQIMFNFEEGLDEFAPDLTDAEYQKRRDEGLSLVVNSAIQGYLQKDDTQAVASLLAGVDPVTGQRIDIDGFVTAEQRLAYQQDLETVGLTVQAQEIADGVMARYDSLPDALAFVRKTYEGEAERQAIAEVKTRFAEQEAAEQKAQDDLFNDLSVRAENGERVSAFEMGGLTVRRRQYVEKQMENARRLAIDPDYARPDDGGVTLARFYADVADRATFAKLSLSDVKAAYELGVTKEVWEKKILPVWSELRAEAGKPPKGFKPTNVLTKQDEANRLYRFYLTEQPEVLEMTKEEQAAHRYKVDALLDRRIKEFEMVQGREATGEEIAEVVTKIIRKTFTYKEPGWWGGETTITAGQPYLMSAAQIEDFADSRDLPADERGALVENWGAILDSLRQMGEDLTPDNIVRKFVKLWETRRAAS